MYVLSEYITQSEIPLFLYLRGIYAKFQVIRGFSQKIPADLLSYDKIHSQLTLLVDIEGYLVELRQNDPSRNPSTVDRI